MRALNKMEKMKSKKRIAFILGSMNRGGAERVISLLANNYAAKDWKVDIIVLLSGKCGYKLNENIKIISLAEKGKSRISQLPCWLLGIRRYLKNNKPNTILSFAARINIIVAIAGLGIKKHLVVSERNDPAADGRSVFVRLATNIIYKMVQKVVFQTKWAQSCFPESVRKNSVIIYNPISVNEKSLGLKSKIIISAGRLENQKNHSLLIDAFKPIHDSYPEYKLYIYGEGTLRDSLERKVQNLGLSGAVMMPGNIENIHHKLAQAEMFVLSSNYEGLSNALLEAMMMGLPCISTNCAGSNEVIEDGVNGLLVPIGSTSKLTEAMRRIILDKKFANQLGYNAAKSSFIFDSVNVIKQWEYVLESYEGSKR